MEFSISTCFNIYLYIEENKINKLQNKIIFCLLVEAAEARSENRRSGSATFVFFLLEFFLVVQSFPKVSNCRIF